MRHYRLTQCVIQTANENSVAIANVTQHTNQRSLNAEFASAISSFSTLPMIACAKVGPFG